MRRRRASPRSSTARTSPAGAAAPPSTTASCSRCPRSSAPPRSPSGPKTMREALDASERRRTRQRRQGRLRHDRKGLRRLRAADRIQDRGQGRQRHLPPRRAAGADLGFHGDPGNSRLGARQRLRRPLEQLARRARQGPARCKADKPFGEWNKFRIVMVGARVERLAERQAGRRSRASWRTTTTATTRRCLPRGPIQLQTHGGEIRWRNIFLREIGARRGEQDPRRARRRRGLQADLQRQGPRRLGRARSKTTRSLDGAIRCKAGKGGDDLLRRKSCATSSRAWNSSSRPAATTAWRSATPARATPPTTACASCRCSTTTTRKYAASSIRARRTARAYGMVAAQRGYSAPDRRVELPGSHRQGLDDQGRAERHRDPRHRPLQSRSAEFMAHSPHPGKDRTSGYFGFAGHNDPVAFRAIRVQKL